MASRREILRLLQSAAMECYPEMEARRIAEMIVTQRGGITLSDLIIEPNAPLDIPDIETICAELRAWRPVQYILGSAYFADMDLEVCSGVLIPRPETEELVEWIATDMPHAKRILDVCTGSGCIALALARRIAQSDVHGIDISSEALTIARRNAERYAPRVVFHEADALDDFSKIVGTEYDVIVSNPPYIPEADRRLMRPNVTDYEPHIALFVPNGDPLLFYRAIAHTAYAMLANGGRLYFEIYESLATEMTAMLRAEGYDVTLREDFRGKPRMICATRII
ncbi:MAG: peptide chain release factor N(5)-glutamine methyltransferase [Alistipes sp.]|nr:peptide chain release factor N(5)-glutamine methyltransferase [Alistipes sp.]